MAGEAVRYEARGNVALLHLDDGKANALSHAVIAELVAGFDRAEKEAAAVLLVGRAGRFSAGFDLGEMGGGPQAASRLVGAGAQLLLRIFMHPRPVVAACSGHALAAGALLLLASDLRIGARGAFKIGLNEVAIGMTPPIFLTELARHRLSKRYLTRAMTQAEIFSPDGAVEAGFLDQVVDDAKLLDTALAEATRLAALGDPAFRNAKQRERSAVADHIRETLNEDLGTITGPNRT